MLARRDYSHPLDTLDREFGRVLNRLWGAAAPEVPSSLAPYAVNVYEDADHFHVEAELPGFSKEEVEITLEEGVLTIRAERQDETGTPNPPHDRQPLHLERRWTRFERSFTLPTAVDENSVHASLNNGILAITLNKREEVKPRKIHITAGNGNSAAVGQAPRANAQPKSSNPHTKTEAP